MVLHDLASQQFESAVIGDGMRHEATYKRGISLLHRRIFGRLTPLSKTERLRPLKGFCTFFSMKGNGTMVKIGIVRIGGRWIIFEFDPTTGKFIGHDGVMRVSFDAVSITHKFSTRNAAEKWIEANP